MKFNRAQKFKLFSSGSIESGACAVLGLSGQVEVVQSDLFPPGAAPLIVCNPPWVPARPGSPLDHAVYDPDSRMLRGFHDGLAAHLGPGGEGWLILSDLAEHLALRSRGELLALIDKAGLMVLSRADARATHPRANAPDDPLHAARAAEVTSLWRLGRITYQENCSIEKLESATNESVGF